MNPSTHIIIDGACSSGCSSGTISHTFIVSYSTDMNATLSVSPVWIRLNSTDGYLSGKNKFNFVKEKRFFFKNNFQQGSATKELTLLPSLFENYSSILYWRIELRVGLSLSSSIGVASITLRKNLPPSNGYCYCQATTGTSLLTYYIVICKDWIDPDGSISSYQFLGKNLKKLEFFLKYCLIFSQ